MNSTEPGSTRGIVLFESRKFPREYIEIPLSYSIKDGEDYPDQVEDPIEGGILIYVKDDLDIGTKLDIEILSPEYFGLESIKATAEIVWTQIRGTNDEEEREYGLRFIAMDGDNVLRLKELLKYLEQ